MRYGVTLSRRDRHDTVAVSTTDSDKQEVKLRDFNRVPGTRIRHSGTVSPCLS